MVFTNKAVNLITLDVCVEMTSLEGLSELKFGTYNYRHTTNLCKSPKIY